MPKLNSSFPSLRKHRASGQAVVTIAGKDYYLGPHGSKTAQRAYDAKIAEWLASGRSSWFGIAQAELTIAQVLNSYRTCPVFRSRADAELTKAIYRRVPVLVREAQGGQPEVNSWGIKFKTMFHMSSDSHHFDHRWAT